MSLEQEAARAAAPKSTMRKGKPGFIRVPKIDLME
jgi:hypothetical protein